MKTKIYFTALLAFIIQVMVQGQTQGIPVSGNKLNPVKHHSTIKKPVTMDGKKVIASEKPSYNAKISTNETSEEMLIRSNRIREASQYTSGNTRTNMIAEANALFNLAQASQIKAFELSGQKNKEAFDLNQTNINAILAAISISAIAGKAVQNLISSAGLNMRFATEIRQEAYSMPTLAAKAGSLSNADEKETIALSEQNQALHLLKSYAANLSSGINLSSYAVK